MYSVSFSSSLRLSQRVRNENRARSAFCDSVFSSRYTSDSALIVSISVLSLSSTGLSGVASEIIFFSVKCFGVSRLCFSVCRRNSVFAPLRSLASFDTSGMNTLRWTVFSLSTHTTITSPPSSLTPDRSTTPKPFASSSTFAITSEG